VKQSHMCIIGSAGTDTNTWMFFWPWIIVQTRFSYQRNAQFLYSTRIIIYTIFLDMFQAILCSSSGGQNCSVTASSIVTLCKRPCSAPVESGLQSPLNRCTVRTSDDTRCCNNTI
jgi:hypothetical protein